MTRMHATLQLLAGSNFCFLDVLKHYPLLCALPALWPEECAYHP